MASNKNFPYRKNQPFPCILNHVTICHTDQKPWQNVQSYESWPRWISSGSVNMIGKCGELGRSSHTEFGRRWWLFGRRSGFFWTLTSQTEQICGMRCWPMILPTCKPRKLERSPCGKQKWHWQQSLNQKEYVLFKWMQWKCDLWHIFGCFSMIYPIASMYGMLPSFTIQINHSCIGKYTSPMDGMGTILWFQHIKNASNKNSLKLPLESFKFKPWLLKVMIHLW